MRASTQSSKRAVNLGGVKYMALLLRLSFGSRAAYAELSQNAPVIRSDSLNHFANLITGASKKSMGGMLSSIRSG